MAAGCGRLLTTDEVQPFISLYRSRPRSRHPWLPKALLRLLIFRSSTGKGSKMQKVRCGHRFWFLGTPFRPTLAPHLLSQVKFEKNCLANATRSRPRGFSPSLRLQSVERSGPRLYLHTGSRADSWTLQSIYDRRKATTLNAYRDRRFAFGRELPAPLWRELCLVAALASRALAWVR